MDDLQRSTGKAQSSDQLESMRLAYLVSQYPAANHTFILREIRGLRSLGFDIRVLSISSADRPPEALTSEEKEELKRTSYVKAISLAGALKQHAGMLLEHPLRYLEGLVYSLRLGRMNPGKTLRSVFYFAEAVIAGRWMERERLSHIHIHFSSTVGLILRHMFPVTISITVHGPAEFSDPIDFWLAEKIKASSFICAISNYARSQLMIVSPQVEWEKIEVSRLGIDPTVFNPRPFRHSPSPFEVICVGRLAPVKAQHILIAAIHRLVREGRDVRLRLIGDGPDRGGLERDVVARGLQAHVVFHGWLNQNEVLARYKEADVFALASFAEGVPVVLMEAMAMTIPCVATRITGIPELIRDGVDGLLVAPSDKDELAHAIARLMSDPSLRQRLGDVGRSRVMEDYDLKRNTARLAQIFCSRIGGATVARRPLALAVKQSVPSADVVSFVSADSEEAIVRR
jgi:colanic acid/amylovoran biosynthesis glycosyltransferase